MLGQDLGSDHLAPMRHVAMAYDQQYATIMQALAKARLQDGTEYQRRRETP
jgi:hypothetical protein